MPLTWGEAVNIGARRGRSGPGTGAKKTAKTGVAGPVQNTLKRVAWKLTSKEIISALNLLLYWSPLRRGSF